MGAVGGAARGGMGLLLSLLMRYVSVLCRAVHEVGKEKEEREEKKRKENKRKKYEKNPNLKNFGEKNKR
jgi:hypothetical protein